MGYKKQDSSSIKNTFMHPFSKLSVQSMGGRGLWLQGGEGVGRDPPHINIYIFCPYIYIRYTLTPGGYLVYLYIGGIGLYYTGHKKNFAV